MRQTHIIQSDEMNPTQIYITIQHSINLAANTLKQSTASLTWTRPQDLKMSKAIEDSRIYLPPTRLATSGINNGGSGAKPR